MSMASSVKMFRVLECLCQEGPAKAVTLSKVLDLNKSSIHRFLNALMEMGYVVQDEESGLYSAGLKIYEMGAQVKNRLGISQIAAPILRRLQVEVNEAVNLGVLQNNEMLTLERFTPDDMSVKIVVKAKLPAYCTALGKILLAHLDPNSFEKYLAETELRAFTRRTVTDPDKFRQMIAQIKVAGIAVDDRELDENILSIATPVRDETGIVVAGMSVTASPIRLSGAKLEEAKLKLLAATKELCCALGNVGSC
jgi:DNA-binding IclR family transcriptional regulator